MKKILVLLIIFIVVGWIVKEIVLPNMVAASISANEYRAYFSCRTIQEACAIYRDQYGSYPESLEALGKDASLKELAREESHGYRYYIEGMPDGYVLRAVPTKMNHTGRYIFEANETGAVFACDNSGECRAAQEGWSPSMPSMPYPYTPGDGSID